MAQWHLGNMYHSGDGVPRDRVEAAKWLRLSAEQGFGFAQGIAGAHVLPR